MGASRKACQADWSLLTFFAGAGQAFMGLNTSSVLGVWLCVCIVYGGGGEEGSLPVPLRLIRSSWSALQELVRRSWDSTPAACLVCGCVCIVYEGSGEFLQPDESLLAFFAGSGQALMGLNTSSVLGVWLVFATTKLPLRALATTLLRRPKYVASCEFSASVPSTLHACSNLHSCYCQHDATVGSGSGVAPDPSTRQVARGPLAYSGSHGTMHTAMPPTQLLLLLF